MLTEKYYDIIKKDVYPLPISITGKGVRTFLKIIQKHLPKLKIHKVASEKKVFDWKIPSEWNIRDAYIIDKYNKKIINFKNHNLHIVGYSTPINKFLNKKQLFEKIYSIKKQPNAIPYITSYYAKDWGFCTTHKHKSYLEKKYKNSDKFKVVIKSHLNPKGHLCYGEYIIPGKSKSEILISTYICHPSMANNELSGPIVAMSLINYFRKSKLLDKTLRFVFLPETIGSIAYLNKNLNILKKNVIGGFNLSCIGDEKQHSCMLTKYENSLSDQSILATYKKLKIKFKKYSFLERGSDERQYNSPGIDLLIASIFRTKYGEYKEYHTSLDDFNFVTKKGISGGAKVAMNAIKILSKKIIPKNVILCEPQMAKRNLYSHLSFKGNKKSFNFRKLLNFLQYADGTNDLERISKLIKLKYKETFKIYKLLSKYNLITN